MAINKQNSSKCKSIHCHANQPSGRGDQLPSPFECTKCSLVRLKTNKPAPGKLTNIQKPMGQGVALFLTNQLFKNAPCQQHFLWRGPGLRTNQKQSINADRSVFNKNPFSRSNKNACKNDNQFCLIYFCTFCKLFSKAYASINNFKIIKLLFSFKNNLPSDRVAATDVAILRCFIKKLNDEESDRCNYQICKFVGQNQIIENSQEVS